MRPILYMPTLSTENKTKTEMDEKAHPQRRKCWSLPRLASVTIISALQISTTLNHYQVIPQSSLPVHYRRTRLHIEDKKRKREDDLWQAVVFIPLDPSPRGVNHFEIAK